MSRVALASVLIAFASVAQADPKPAPLEGATELARFTASTGFVDDAIGGDATRIAYVVADGSTGAQLHVVTLAGKTDAVIDVSAIATHPTRVELIGARAFLIGTQDDGQQVAGMIELADGGKSKPAGTAVYKLGPATHITLITRDGKPRVALHRQSLTTAGTKHEVEIVALDTGRRLQAGRALELDATGTSKPLGFHVNHWSDGWSRAHGIKDGEWNQKRDQRTPEVEATYDLAANKFDTKDIANLFEQQKRFQVLADAAAGLDFVRLTWDSSGIQLWSGGKSHDVKLEQAMKQYDPKSLQGFVAADGSAWFAMKVDPVNADAVGRKKRDVEYLDVFSATADGKATRRMRVLAGSARYRFGVAGDKIWLLERNNGFERGGKTLVVYQPS